MLRPHCVMALLTTFYVYCSMFWCYDKLVCINNNKNSFTSGNITSIQCKFQRPIEKKYLTD